MKLVVGLGNPGREYEKTRHNIGAELVWRFARDHSARPKAKKFSSLAGEGEIEGDTVVFLLPQTYMNRSGEAVAEAVSHYRLPSDRMIVVHDDIDLPLGRLKLDFDAGAAGHKGVASIIERIGSQRFSRIRLGIGRPSGKEEVEAYVLAPFSPAEKDAAENMKEEAKKVLENWLKEEK